MFPQKCIGQTLLIEASRPPLSNPKFAANYQVFLLKMKKNQSGKMNEEVNIELFSSSWLTSSAVTATVAATSDHNGNDKTIQKQTEC